MSGIHTLLAGHTLAERYRIGEVIGRGGFAAVYEARDERLDRTVAVKVITLPARDEAVAEELRTRFQREARASAGLQHPNVVAVYDFGTDPKLGLDFLVMERLMGEDLRERLRRPEPIPLLEAVHILHSAAQGIAAGHKAGIIHRDVKPGNIFLVEHAGGSRGRVCVLDFGIALLAADDATRLTQHGIALSIPYASPEQLAPGGELTPASDVFSLGVVAYEVLGRRRPYSGDATRAAEERAAPLPPLREVNPDVPPHISQAVQRALSAEPSQRFPDAGGFAHALEAEPDAPAAAAPTVIAVAPARAAPRADEPARRSGRRMALGGAAALLLAASAGVFLLTRGGSEGDGRVAVRADSVRTRRVAIAPVTPPTRPSGDSAAAGPAPVAAGGSTDAKLTTPAPAPTVAERSAPAPRRPEPAPSVPRVTPPAPAREAPARERAPVASGGGAEFRENLSHPCQSRSDAGDAVTCLNRDLAAADAELNAAYRQALSALGTEARTALVLNQRAWLRRYDAVITSYYSTSWGQHSRVRVLPSQIQALRDRTAYLRRIAAGR